MKIWIADNSSKIVVCLQYNRKTCGETEIVCLEGELPEGLIVQDLTQLGIVVYEPGARGRPVPRVCPIEPSEDLEYVRALNEAMPPGFYVARVESEKIEQQQKEKAKKFEQELELLADDADAG